MPRNANQGKNTNYSLDFDGASYIDLGNSSLGLTANSISIWFKTTSTTSGQQLLSKYGSTYQFQFRLETNGTITLYSFENQSTFATLQSASGYNDGNWHNVTTTFNTTDGHKMYVDGNTTPVDTDTANKSALQSSSERMLIGARDSSTGVIDTARYFNGDISFISIFDYALSSSQVTTLYGSSSTGIGNPMSLNPKPVAYYPLGTSAWNGQYLAENNAIGDYVFDFLTSNSYIDTNFTLPASYTSYSYSIWYKQTSSFTGDNYLIGNWNQGSSAIADMRVSVRFNGGTKLRIITGNNTTGYQTPDLDVSSLLLDGNWHHIVVTVVSGEIKLYIDKNLEATHSNSNIVTGIAANRSYTLGFSGNTTYAGYLDNSQLSNFQIFNTALSATDVETLYNYGSPIRTLANIPQSSNLKAWYKLDASEVYNNTSTEWSIDNNKYPSTYNSSINLVRASSEKIDIANGSELDFTEDFTMSIWVNLTTSNNNMGIFNKTSQANGNGVTLWKRGGANFEFYVSEYSNVLTFASQGDNIWQQITITLNRTTGERIAYINGEQAATLTHIKTFAFPNQGWDIGTFATNSPNYLDAKVSNFKLFNTVLSPTEVQTLYNNGTPLTDMSSFTSLKGWWKLNNLSSGLTDSSSNSNNATISNSATDYAGFVNTLAGDSSGMSQSNLVQSDLQTVAPYSKYAMNFDGTDDLITISNESNFDFDRTDPFSLSCWFKCDDVSSNNHIINKLSSTGDYTGYNLFINNTDSKLWFYLRHNYSSPNQIIIKSDSALVNNVWYNLVVSYDGSSTAAGCKMYIDNVNVSTTESDTLSSSILNNQPLRIGGRSPLTTNFANGSISNVSVWNTALTVSQVSEIYNEGLPGNLNSHSAYSNLVSWWQLGENSSFNGNDWICADEKGTNNGSSTGMPVGALVNGVGTTANGTSTGMAVGDLVGNAPYSTANAISSGMAVTAKGTDVPS